MSREIQIEEMSADIQKLIHSTAISRALASYLYKWGWRKPGDVVRCKDCKHWESGYGYCKRVGVDAYGNSIFHKDSCCSGGERREE